MIPTFIEDFGEVLALSPAYALDTWLHVVLGVFAEAAGVAFVAMWLAYSISDMRCAIAKRYMTPTLVVWLVAIITGALIHILEVL